MLSNILVVDDEYQIKQIFQDIFREEIEKGYYKFDFATDGEEALHKIQSGSIPSVDLLLTDVKMPKIDGLSLIKLLQQDRIDIKTIIISAFVSHQDIEEIIENNDSILGFLSKPIENIDQLKNIVKNNLNILQEPAITSIFNYHSLQPQDYDFIQQRTEEIKFLIKRSTQTIVEIGCKLIEVKTRLKHGQFGDWLKLEFDWSEPTAQRFMRVARKFKSVNLTDLPIVPSALYLLAASSIPEEARNEAISRASEGEPINYKTAKQIKDKYTKSNSPSLNPESHSKAETIAPKINQKHIVLTERLNLERENNLTVLNSVQIKSPTSTSNNFAIADLMEPESWWRLGQEHLLYCGHPQAETFQRSIPQSIDLNIAFPERANWRQSIPGKIKSELVFFSEYKDLDLTVLREAVERLFLLYTEDSSIVIFSYLPDPQLILLADRLKCICRIAEPNLDRCQQVIQTVQQAGLNAVRLA